MATKYHVIPMQRMLNTDELNEYLDEHKYDLKFIYERRGDPNNPNPFWYHFTEEVPEPKKKK